MSDVSQDENSKSQPMSEQNTKQELSNNVEDTEFQTLDIDRQPSEKLELFSDNVIKLSESHFEETVDQDQ